MTGERPHLVVLAGPNGAGKSTVAGKLLQGVLGVDEFVNADVIARGLSGFQPEGAAIEAGRIMLKRLRHLAEQRMDFAFETTLASRSFAPWIARLVESGYAFHLVFIWLPSADMAVSRVQDRVRHGGHAVPEETIRRRYRGGLRNFFELYQPLATTWRVYDNTEGPRERLIVMGEGKVATTVINLQVWERINEQWRGANAADEVD